jgi:hypothetical protein
LPTVSVISVSSAEERYPWFAGRNTVLAMITSWRDISELTKADVALLEGDERARFTPEILLWTARELARYRLWEQAN